MPTPGGPPRVRVMGRTTAPGDRSESSGDATGLDQSGTEQDSPRIPKAPRSTVVTMRQTSTSRTTVTLHELPAPAPSETAPLPEREQVVFVTNAVRRRGSLRTRSDQHRPVLAAVVR